MKLSDYPPDKCRDLLWRILDRHYAARDRWPPYKGIRTQVYLSIDEARLIFSAGQWLSRYDTWVNEAAAAKGNIGVWPANHSLKQCATFFSEAAQTLNKDDPIILLSERDMKVVESAAEHLNHYFLMLSFKENKSRGNWKKK